MMAMSVAKRHADARCQPRSIHLRPRSRVAWESCTR